MLKKMKHERERKDYIGVTFKLPKEKPAKVLDKTILFVERLKKVLPVAGREIKNQVTALVMTALETEGIYEKKNKYIIKALVDGILEEDELRESARLVAEQIIKVH